jgi:hypothetical protein
MAFVKRLGILEIFFAFLTFISRYYNQLVGFTTSLPVLNPIELSFITVVIISLVQIFLIILIFFSWYLEKFTITSKALFFSRTDAFRKTLIPDLKTITAIEVSQGKFSSSFNYGSIIVYTQDMGQILLHNLPDPHLQAANLRHHVSLLGKDNTPQFTNIPLDKLLKKPEGQQLEYKSSLQWDYRERKLNKDLHKPIMKTISAFLNSSGGTLLIGVNDKSKVLGLKEDYQTLTKKNSDGFENTFTMTVKKHLGIECMRHIAIQFETVKGKDVAKIIVNPSTKPVYFRYNDSEEFYIRTGNSSQPLSISQTVSYITEHFQN